MEEILDDQTLVADQDLLDVAPDADEKALRTAYARKLKIVRPETDPAGFQALRAAYDRLIERAKPPPSAETVAPQGPDSSSPSFDPHALGEVLFRFNACRRRGDRDGALRAVDAEGAGALDLRRRHALEDSLFDSVRVDPSVHPALLRSLADRFDWRDATSRQEARDAEANQNVRERIEAADLVESFRGRAAAAASGEGPPADRVILTMLGPYREGLFDKGLDDEEKAVAVEVLSSTLDHLCPVDGFIDARMLAAARAVVGAAPLPMADMPSLPEAPSAAPPETSSSDSRWWIWGIIIAFYLVFGLSGLFDSSKDKTGTTDQAPAPSTESPADDAQATARYNETHADIDAAKNQLAQAVIIPRTVGDRTTIDLSPLLIPPVLRAVDSIAVQLSPTGEPQSMTPRNLTVTPILEVPPGSAYVTVQFIFSDNSQSEVRTFDNFGALRGGSGLAMPPFKPVAKP